MPENSGTGEITQFPGPDPGAYYSTGLDGSSSPDVASATAGPVVGTPVVSSVYVSSQLPEGQVTLPVTSGDTSGFSDDQPVHASPLLPGAAYAAETGIGHGHTGHRA
jgi:hypothetical protein